MDPKLIWMLVALAVIMVAAALCFVVAHRRRRLQQQFGPEYARTVQQTGSRWRADATLEARTRRVERLHIRPLSPPDAERFSEAWRQVQSRFVDAPEAAVSNADRLVGEVMAARGYPLGDFEQRAADISVDHPRVVVHYRAAHGIARRHAGGEASTEDLRQAFVHYRALFEDLLDGQVPPPRPLSDEDRELVRGSR